MITKTITDVIKEAAKTEEFNTNDFDSDELRNSFNECISNIPVIGKGIVAYRSEMVPVFKNESSYFVEMDNVVKYMNSWDIRDVKEAMENIAEANEIPVSELSLVIETKEYMESVIESASELSKLGSKELLENCELSVKLINMLKSEGINVVLTH